MDVIGWIDHFDYYGPLVDTRMLEEPKYLVSAIIVSQSEEGFEHAIRGWSRFGTYEIVETTYVYITQVKRGVIDRKELLQKLLFLLPRFKYFDILALQRVLKLGLGITTCDLGLVVLSYISVRGGRPPQRPLGTLFEIRGDELMIYIARNNKGKMVYDGETMCIIPMSAEEPRHPLYEAYLKGFRIYTEGMPTERDLCVVHKKLKLRCKILQPNAGEFPTF
ncbi:conserved hypothetical protein [Pyrobaculum islandicum DSM 4184]|uniref:Uncharacterized protein n=1 Tax=Pyrobaculum islandicum (strain DSM 4184 / JCM 9189 / GEO3) TaxID=384616 RepID=A1RS75_PYRIL|nr:conserved hypothetical protein [Pyrobaculum islandicum DSM 4184]